VVLGAMTAEPPLVPRPLPHPIPLAEVADRIGATLIGDGTRPVDRICHPSAATRPTDLALAMQADTLAALNEGAAQLAAVAEGAAGTGVDRLAARIEIARPRFALAQLSALFAQPGWPA